MVLDPAVLVTAGLKMFFSFALVSCSSLFVVCFLKLCVGACVRTLCLDGMSVFIACAAGEAG